MPQVMEPPMRDLCFAAQAAPRGLDCHHPRFAIRAWKYQRTRIGLLPGTPIQPNRQWRRNAARYKHLDEIARRVDAIEKETKS